MSAVGEFDVVVIGAGPGGYVCAIRAAQLGLKTACVEIRETLGGTCLNVGCIPSKALLESSHHFQQLKKEFADHGITVDKISLDLKKMQERKSGVVQSITSGVDFLFKKNKITWLHGWGRVEAPHKVSVKDKEGKTSLYNAKHIVIATGSEPIELPFAKFDRKMVVDSTDALMFETVPEHLIVIGAGVIGLELGSVWSRLGSKVTVIEALPHIMGNTDSEVSRNMMRILQKQGMEFHLETMLSSVETKNQKVIAKCQTKGESLSVEGDRLLVAIGRRPSTSKLGLDELGVQKEKNGWLIVDEKFATSVKSVYAIGDAIRGAMLAHKAEEEGIALGEILAGKAGHVNYESVPSIVYTYPEVASVGLSEDEVKKRGLAYKVGKFNFRANGRSKAMGNVDGFVKIIADAKTDRLIGVHILGPLASEVIGEVAVAFEYGASSEDLARSVHAHPTLAEAVKEAALDVHKQSIHA